MVDFKLLTGIDSSIIKINESNVDSQFIAILESGADKLIAEKVALLNYYTTKELVLLIAEIKQLLGESPQSRREFYDLPEAAEYLGIGKSTLRKALSDGEIICDRVGRKLRFSKAQLDKYIRRGKSDAEIDTEVENAILSNKRKRK